jgi:hypothetical protein
LKQQDNRNIPPPIGSSRDLEEEETASSPVDASHKVKWTLILEQSLVLGCHLIDKQLHHLLISTFAPAFRRQKRQSAPSINMPDLPKLAISKTREWVS